MAKESIRETFRRELADVERRFPPVINRAEDLWKLSAFFDEGLEKTLMRVEAGLLARDPFYSVLETLDEARTIIERDEHIPGGSLKTEMYFEIEKLGRHGRGLNPGRKEKAEFAKMVQGGPFIDTINGFFISHIYPSQCINLEARISKFKGSNSFSKIELLIGDGWSIIEDDVNLFARRVAEKVGRRLYHFSPTPNSSL